QHFVFSSAACLRPPYFFPFHALGAHPPRHSFPTRRSSDLSSASRRSEVPTFSSSPLAFGVIAKLITGSGKSSPGTSMSRSASSRDRKSTRLNSSHGSISYAVFCLKKKNKNPTQGFCKQIDNPINHFQETLHLRMQGVAFKSGDMHGDAETPDDDVRYEFVSYTQSI